MVVLVIFYQIIILSFDLVLPLVIGVFLKLLAHSVILDLDLQINTSGKCDLAIIDISSEEHQIELILFPIFQFLDIQFDGAQLNIILVKLESDDLRTVIDHLEVLVFILRVIIALKRLSLLIHMFSHDIQEIVASMVQIALDILHSFHFHLHFSLLRTEKTK